MSPQNRPSGLVNGNESRRGQYSAWEARMFKMFNPVLVAIAVFGLASPACAAGPSLFGDLFGGGDEDSIFAPDAGGIAAARPHTTHTHSGGRVTITVNIASQEMTVTEDGETLYDWDVSTGRKGYDTPTGTYRPVRMEDMWYSSKYENAPMPWSIFFYGGYAIHGTEEVNHLGHRASHGCVRLDPDNAEVLYDLVKSVGMQNTRVTLVRG
jgi:lipoprotein-anchoring transpeptidase ErfK/SrfK